MTLELKHAVCVIHMAGLQSTVIRNILIGSLSGPYFANPNLKVHLKYLRC